MARVDAAAVYANALLYRETVAVMPAAAATPPAGIRARLLPQGPLALPGTWLMRRPQELPRAVGLQAEGLQARRGVPPGRPGRAAEPAAILTPGPASWPGQDWCGARRDGRKAPLRQGLLHQAFCWTIWPLLLRGLRRRTHPLRRPGLLRVPGLHRAGPGDLPGAQDPEGLFRDLAHGRLVLPGEIP